MRSPLTGAYPVWAVLVLIVGSLPVRASGDAHERVRRTTGLVPPGRSVSVGVRRRLGALTWLIAHDHNTRAGRLRVDELQPLQLVRVLEETLPLADDDGMEHQVELVEQILLEQGPHERGAALDTDGLARLLL